MYVVEVSNPRLANDSDHERWESQDAVALAAHLESEAGLSHGDSAGAALAVAVDGETFEHVDGETGRIVTAWSKTPVGAPS